MKIGYCRVSTDKEAQDTSVDAQVEALTRAGCVRVFKERQSAYGNRRRKQWETCKDLIRSGKVTHFMICSLARGSRRQENADISRLCKSCGVEFVVLDGTNADVSTPEGLLMVGILDTVNRVDSTIKGLAVKRGLAARRRAGATGHGKTPYGYVYNGVQPVPDPHTWKKAQQLWGWLRDNEFIAIRVIRQHPDVPFSEPGLRRWMRNPLLMGRPTYSDHQVEPLVDPAEWHQVQELVASRYRFKARAPRRIHLFTQSVTCQCCGRWMNYAFDRKARIKCHNAKCEWYGRGLAEWKVKGQVISALQNAVPQMLAAAEQAMQTKDQPLTKEQIELRQRLDLMLQLQRSGAPELDKSIAATRLELDALTVRKGADWESFAPLIRQPAFLEGISEGELRPIIAELVEQILYVGDAMKVEITLRDPS